MEIGATLLLTTLKGAVAVGAALLLARCARRVPAGILHGVVLGALLLHPLALLAPRLPVSFTVRVSEPSLGSLLPARLSTPISEVDAVGATGGGVRGVAASGDVDRTAWPAILWGLVAAVILLCNGFRTHAARRRILEGATPMRSAARELSRHAGGVRRRVRVLAGPGCQVPVTFGSVRPVIVLPEAAAAWSAGRMRVVLAHEMAHICRWDDAVAHLGRAICALFWFSPAVWIGRRALRGLAEHACDARVLRSGVGWRRYGIELIEVARCLRNPVPRAPAFAGAARLEDRLHAIRTTSISRHSRPATAITAGLAGAVAGGLLLAQPLLAAAASVAPLPSALTGALRVRALATGCPYAGGRHVNRSYPGAGGTIHEVAWAGDGCSVQMRTDDAGWRALRGWPGAWPEAAELELTVEGGSGVRLRSARGDGGRASLRGSRGGAGMTAREIRRWLADFREEMDAHTGALAAERVPALLSLGGVDAVLSAARATQGDHAAGIYLEALLDAVRLTPRQLSDFLDIAATRVENDAQLTRVLVRVAERYTLVDANRDTYLAAASTLQARAALAEVTAALD